MVRLKLNKTNKHGVSKPVVKFPLPKKLYIISQTPLSFLNSLYITWLLFPPQLWSSELNLIQAIGITEDHLRLYFRFPPFWTSWYNNTYCKSSFKLGHIQPFNSFFLRCAGQGKKVLPSFIFLGRVILLQHIVPDFVLTVLHSCT